jgi:hypothetical protein
MASFSRTVVKLVALLGLGVASLTASAVEMRGFRGVMWGDDVAKLGKSTLAYTDGDVSCYTRERENMLFGDSPLQEVRYCFHRNRLFMVALDTEVDQQTLLSEFQSSYGPPDARETALVSWGSGSTASRVDVVSPPAGGHALMLIYSNRVEPGLGMAALGFATAAGRR